MIEMDTKNQKAIAQDIMRDRPAVNELYVTVRGEFFTEKYLAVNAQDGEEKGIKIYNRSLFSKEKKSKKSIEDIKIDLLEIKDLNTLNTLKKDEKRVPAIEAIEARIAEITASDE